MVKAKSKSKPQEDSKLSPDEVLRRVVNEAVKISLREVRKDFTKLVFDIESLKLVVYGNMKNCNVDESLKTDIMLQEDRLASEVEALLKRMNEIKLQQEREKEMKKNEI